MPNPFETLAHHKLAPVIALDDAAHAAPLAAALVAGGLPVAEVTFRTAAAEESIRTMAARGDLLVIAGTVLTAEQVDRAAHAGAVMVVSPGFSPKVVERCQKLGLPVCPGVATPTDLQAALDCGLGTMKFFPAEALGGVKTLKAISAPYASAVEGGVKFMPTGGVGPGNLLDYLALPSVVACGGSWMVAPKLYAGGDFAPVEAAVREAVTLAQSLD
ncbi:putative KHG/KDPG aldolase [Pseudobythopirellula maris]|uniref:2-dehydro-3-deoxy-phosphogluconate aldolase n=1 Tax=Pseudobythopirellula maris TaxID=2527991 RepID=A0A5C5ZR50_9BACT|nr:bifunctional 4-hydroxy-2-oxoglutarate aldolase/2-dehydro-3-deoxy-phosphogluconate aldolase [Pseudobythopirellula maris]TWT89760.1 putative KHG/KDPG aldolase [Pseudobythopirellula maris]